MKSICLSLLAVTSILAFADAGLPQYLPEFTSTSSISNLESVPDSDYYRKTITLKAGEEKAIIFGDTNWTTAEIKDWRIRINANRASRVAGLKFSSETIIWRSWDGGTSNPLIASEISETLMAALKHERKRVRVRSSGSHGSVVLRNENDVDMTLRVRIKGR